MASYRKAHDPETRDPKWKKGIKKSWVIFWRSLPERQDGFVGLFGEFDWKVYRRYATERARDEALSTLRRKAIPSHGAFVLYEGYEYKKGFQA